MAHKLRTGCAAGACKKTPTPPLNRPRQKRPTRHPCHKLTTRSDAAPAPQLRAAVPGDKRESTPDSVETLQWRGESLISAVRCSASSRQLLLPIVIERRWRAWRLSLVWSSLEQWQGCPGLRKIASGSMERPASETASCAWLRNSAACTAITLTRTNTDGRRPALQ